MWIRITEISIKQVDANHLSDPKNPDNLMVLNLFQREVRTVFWVTKNKRAYPQYTETSTGQVISKRKWTGQMKTFAQQELEKIPLQKSLFKITIIGWLFILLAFGILSYLIYDGIQAPQKAEKFQQEMTEKAKVKEGDIYFGNYRIYKEKGSVIGSKGGFGWFKIVEIEGDTYHVAKSVEISDSAKPKEELNSADFEQQTSAVKAKELSAYTKNFVSKDGLIEFNFEEKKKEK